jgi:hypothetical protein
MSKRILSICIVSLITNTSWAQNDNATKDSLYIDEVESAMGSDKVLHSEPLFIDLIRDLGARKGEKEWNVAFGLTDKLNYDAYEALIEYEWAPINRLGFEIELPFTFYSGISGTPRLDIPSNQLNSLKLATQWSFFVSEKHATSMALGYINEFELSDFRNFANPLIKGNIYNPFLVAAKRWGNNFHSLIYTGPKWFHEYHTNVIHTAFEMNTSFHYMISGTRNFIGVEINKSWQHKDFDMTLRPQMRLAITENTMIGIVAGIPIEREYERFSAFVRLILEPPHKKH